MLAERGVNVKRILPTRDTKSTLNLNLQYTGDVLDNNRLFVHKL
jgi:hypothetical protein